MAQETWARPEGFPQSMDSEKTKDSSAAGRLPCSAHNVTTVVHVQQAAWKGGGQGTCLCPEAKTISEPQREQFGPSLRVRCLLQMALMPGLLTGTAWGNATWQMLPVCQLCDSSYMPVLPHSCPTCRQRAERGLHAVHIRQRPAVLPQGPGLPHLDRRPAGHHQQPRAGLPGGPGRQPHNRGPDE